MIKKSSKSQGFSRSILVLFGITGDLSQKKILPSLYLLDQNGLLPADFRLVGMSRKDLSGEAVRRFVFSVLSASPHPVKTSSVTRFLKRISFVQGDANNPRSFQALAAHLRTLEASGRQCANRLFYFATLPSLYLSIAGKLQRARILTSCAEHKREMRVVIEKPFGSDTASARRLDRELHKYFTERQIYRMDHYLGKETVQNIFTARFANSIFEPIWNRNFIDHVQISGVMETAGVGSRGAYFEETGCLRDVVQSHLLQLVALTAMEQPMDFSAEEIRAERARVLRSLRIWNYRQALENSRRGQYAGGSIGKTPVAAYRKERNVKTNSTTETFTALKLEIENERWAGVPFYLRSGKRLARSYTEISLHFKPAPQYLFPAVKSSANILTFRIQPDESIHLRLVAKQPGFGMEVRPVDMVLGYHQAFGQPVSESYVRLLLDFFQGDQRLFASSEEVEASWKFITPILQAWKRAPLPRFPDYRPGTYGPKEAQAFIENDGRKWWVLSD